MLDLDDEEISQAERLERIEDYALAACKTLKGIYWMLWLIAMTLALWVGFEIRG